METMGGEVPKSLSLGFSIEALPGASNGRWGPKKRQSWSTNGWLMDGSGAAEKKNLRRCRPLSGDVIITLARDCD